MQIFAVILIIITFTQSHLTHAAQTLWPGFNTQEKCSGSRGLKYLSGDALVDSLNCVGPNNVPYPRYIFLNF